MGNVKNQTLELYDSLPQDKNQRIQKLDIRDKIIELNYNFFHYVSAKTYIVNTTVEFDDKLQCCLYHFCRIWWYYKWDGTGDDNHKGYRRDVSFATFFKPRLSSYIRNDLLDISYTSRRTTLKKIGQQLNKPWTEVTLEDLYLVKLDPSDMFIARSYLDPGYTKITDESLSYYVMDNPSSYSSIMNMDDNYNSVEDMLIHDTIDKERKLTAHDLKYLSELFDIDYRYLCKIYPKILNKLVDELKESIKESNEFMY